MASDSVTLAYLHQDEVPHSWHHSVTNLLMFDASTQQRVIRGGYIAFSSGIDVARSRNLVAQQFLDEKQADWLFWTDSDMGFTHDALERLLAVADPVERPIVGGLCFGWKDVGPDGLSGMVRKPFTTMFRYNKRDDGAEAFSPIWHYPVHELVPVDATGSAFLVIHRSVLETMRTQHGDEWYRPIPNPTMPGSTFGEDVSFCIRAKAAGFPIYVHTGIRTNHHKQIHVNEGVYWSQVDAPSATEPVSVIVPVIDRPRNAEPFMRSLRASTGLAYAIAVCEADDIESQDAWLKAGANLVLSSDHHSFADKVNEAYHQVDTPWLFLTGDDVRFRSGWWDHLSHVAGVSGCSVVGANDLFNPRVMDGEHANHMAIRTDYVAEWGASWDGPDVVCHGGYRHWYVDDEIVTVAKQRHTFTVALGSIVEHLHPLAGKADDDEVYRKGQRHAEKDRELFLTRLATYGKQVAA